MLVDCLFCLIARGVGTELYGNHHVLRGWFSLQERFELEGHKGIVEKMIYVMSGGLCVCIPPIFGHVWYRTSIFGFDVRLEVVGLWVGLYVVYFCQYSYYVCVVCIGG